MSTQFLSSSKEYFQVQFMGYKDYANWYNSLKSLESATKGTLSHFESLAPVKDIIRYYKILQDIIRYYEITTTVSTNTNLRKASWFGSLPRKFRSITPPSSEAPVRDYWYEQGQVRNEDKYTFVLFVHLLHTRTKDHVPVVFARCRI